MDVLSSAPVTLWVDFQAPQGLVIPDVGSVSYALYDGAGFQLIVQEGLAPEAEATGASISIAPIHNILGTDRAFERRIVVVNWTAEGRSFSRRLGYRVVELPLHSVTPEHVRAYLGINEDELRDDEVDLFSAYLTLQTAVGRDRFEAALSAGTMLELRAERAIVLTAASQLFPSLRFRIAQMKGDGTLKFERLKDPTAFADLVRATGDELLGILPDLTGVAPSNETVPVLVQLTTITADPITGVAPVTTSGG